MTDGAEVEPTTPPLRSAVAVMSSFVPVALLWLQLQLGALRVLERIPGPAGDVALVLVWGASALGAWRLLHGGVPPAVRRMIATPWPAVALVALVAACGVFVYPDVDGRRSTGGGSDADDGVVLVVDRLRDGLDPYGADTYLGNPPTTGPGSALWGLAFPGRRAYACAVVLALSAALAVLRRWCGSWEVPSLTALLVGASVPFWEGVAQGSDHLTMAAGLAVVTAAAGRRARPGGPWVAWALLAAVIATWRAAYLHLPLLLAMALWSRSRQAAVVVGAVGTAAALAMHGALLARTDGWDAYDPVQQLLVKSDDDLTAGGRALVVATIVGAGVVVLAELRRRAPRAEVLVLAGIGAPMAAVALAGAATAEDPAAWSEASYLLPTLVLAAVVAARSVVESPVP